jgi:hypothetical protein
LGSHPAPVEDDRARVSVAFSDSGWPDRGLADVVTGSVVAPDSRWRTVVSTYGYEHNGERFEIEVNGLRVDIGSPSQCFIARIKKVSGDHPVTVVRKGNHHREIYGQTETWALRNARALLDRENWTLAE